MNKKQFLSALNDVYCRLAPTAHGVGVVAVRPIPKGTDPFKNCDRGGDVLLIPAAELDAYDAPEEAKQMVRDYFVLEGGNYYASTEGVDSVDKSFFVNHSDEPNLASAENGEGFRAARDIAAGEELTADYNTYDEASAPYRKTK